MCLSCCCSTMSTLILDKFDYQKIINEIAHSLHKEFQDLKVLNPDIFTYIYSNTLNLITFNIFNNEAVIDRTLDNNSDYYVMVGKIPVIFLNKLLKLKIGFFLKSLFHFKQLICVN